MFKHILLATDGSTASERAARMAVQLARSQGARLTAVHVVDAIPYLGIGDTNPMGLHAYLSAGREHAAAAHAKVAALCAETQPALPVELRLVENAPTIKGILDTAEREGCDLIVAGTHGRTGLEGLLIGSVASKLVSTAPTPVLIVR
ncbi:universal stress protein [Ramlibacter solisilvae]|uniref:Universal stress protein n=1 Tax=Ramlibacter tataouinensis TaxID=94132 RepID=A0A127JXY1_9BURK|nr:universal stress protein [Ramlibacter tataouinensis]AMO24769.1 universal stress protein UspA [Ramlibacter tataouinensis]